MPIFFNMDFKKEADEAKEAVVEHVSKGVAFLKSSILRTSVIATFIVTLALLFVTWQNVYFEILNNNAWNTFLTTSMAIMSSPLFLIALYYYTKSMNNLFKKISRFTAEERESHKTSLIIAGASAGLAGWTIKLFFLPAVFYLLVTIFMVKLLTNKK